MLNVGKRKRINTVKRWHTNRPYGQTVQIIVRSLFIMLCFLAAANMLQAQLVQTCGLSGGGTWSLEVNGTDSIAGACDSGVYCSTNNGTSWTAVNSVLLNPVILFLTVAGTNLYAGSFGGRV